MLIFYNMFLLAGSI